MPPENQSLLAEKLIVYIADITLSMVIRLASVLFYIPIFLLPAVVVASLGIWTGQVYMQAQLSVKREMANAKAPVLGIFGSAISGLSEFFCSRFSGSFYLCGHT